MEVAANNPNVEDASEQFAFRNRSRGFSSQETLPETDHAVASPRLDMPLVSAPVAMELGRMQAVKDVRTLLPLMAVDGIAVLTSVLLAGSVEWFVTGGNYFSSFSFAFALISVTILFQCLHKLYPACGLSCAAEFSACMRTWLVVAIVSGGGLWLASVSGAGWLAYGVFAVSLVVTLCLGRPIVRRMLANCDWWTQPVIVLGDCELAQELFEKLDHCRSEGLRPLGMAVVGHHYWEQGDDQQPRFFLRKMEHIEKMLLDRSVCRVAVASAGFGDTNTCQRYSGIPHVMLPTGGHSRHSLESNQLRDAGSVSELQFHHRDIWAVEFLGARPFVTRKQASWLMSPTYRLSKRVIDLALVVGSSPIWLPVMGAIAFVIAVTSKGPVLYVQERIGFNGIKFGVLKFRTMVVNADQDLEQLLSTDSELKTEWELKRKLHRDPRVTTVGRFLRKTSLDELPQLLNVLLGQMSLVGPRPLPEYHLAEAPGFFVEARQSVLPGIAGIWQANGRDGEISKVVFYDSMYIRERSLLLDLSLLFQTIVAVFLLRGAK